MDNLLRLVSVSDPPEHGTVRHWQHDPVESELLLAQPSCFSDSKVALFRIRVLSKEWKARSGVQNQLSEIRKLLPVDCWRHCSGKDNPKDLPSSRGLTPLELTVNALWHNSHKPCGLLRHLTSWDHGSWSRIWGFVPPEEAPTLKHVSDPKHL